MWQAQQAQWAEEDKLNKNKPQKERDALDAQITKDKDALVAKQEQEGEELLSAQAEANQQLSIQYTQDESKMTQDHAEERQQIQAANKQNVELLKQEHDDAKVQLLGKHEKDKIDHKEKLEMEQEAFHKEESSLSDTLQSRKEEFRKKVIERQTKAIEDLSRRLDGEKKKMDIRQEERRKFNAAELEDELSRFAAKQDEERNDFMTKQKAKEKALIDFLLQEETALRVRIAEEQTRMEDKHRAEINDQEAKDKAIQSSMKSKHAGQRSSLASEQQKAKNQFLSQQQAQRDQLAAKNRYELSAVVESAQNELNLALLGKSCVLLSGPPAVGKSCLVSQLALLALNDKKQGSLLPIVIKVQQLQRRLIEDQHHIQSLLKQETPDEDKLPAFDLFVLRDLMRKWRNGKKRIKDYFQQWDTDHSGTIDREEFTEAVRSLGMRNVSEFDLNSAYNQLDLDGSGEIDCTRRLTICTLLNLRSSFTDSHHFRIAAHLFFR